MSAAKPSRTMLDAILSEPSDAEKIQQGKLPSGSVWHLETALTFARKARTADNAEKKDEFIRVVIEQLEEIKKKVEAAK